MIDFKNIGRHMSRPRFQRGQLDDTMPKRGKLARGRYWARWRIYSHTDPAAAPRRAEKIIDRGMAEHMGFTFDYSGPLRKVDAQRVLDRLILESNAPPAPPAKPKALATFGEYAREYLALNRTSWEASTARVSVPLIESHLIAKLGDRPVATITELELQQFMDTYVEGGSSKSFLTKLVFYLRAILKQPVKKKLLDFNPAEDVRARSRKKSCALVHTSAECAALCLQVSGRDHLAFGILIQCALRAEELFALRRNDVHGDELMIDEAIPGGRLKATKTEASNTKAHLPPTLRLEMEHHLETIDPEPDAWLFPSAKPGVPSGQDNFLRRVLKPAAIRAGVAVTRDAKGNFRTGVNFQSLRRTSSTIFGSKAKDPKLMQAHMRHASPQISLEVYQQAIPSDIKAAALAVEQELLSQVARIEEEAQRVRVV